jgi:hypothetical protein
LQGEGGGKKLPVLDIRTGRMPQNSCWSLILIVRYEEDGNTPALVFEGGTLGGD